MNQLKGSLYQPLHDEILLRDSRLFDSHIHLNSETLRGWFELNWKEYKDWVFNNVSTNLEDLEVALEQSREHENVFVTAGIHPLDLKEGEDHKKNMEVIESYIEKGEKIIAIGETGFDFYRADKDQCYESQRESFSEHYELALRHSLPLMLHIRSAHEEALEFLENMPEHRGIIHCFSGDWKLAKRYLELPGKWMISLSPVIFRNLKDYGEIVDNIDIDRLLVETDSPYLAENNTAVVEIIEFIAERRNMDFGECRRILWDNFCDFFKLKL